MYASFYNLTENPFNLTPDPNYHFVNDSTREALASLLYGIESRKGFLTLVGDAGTGKTTLLRRVFETIENDTRVVFVFNPGVTFDELLEFICIELGIRTDSFRRLHLLDRLNQYLLEQLTAGYNVVVMIDEAQTLEDKVLEELRLLSNLETSKEKILQIILSGQPELEDKLRKPSMRQLRQRIGARASLQPMKQNEIGPYIETRLRSAGSEEGQLFTAPALRKIWLASKGIPRIVNVICDNALVIGFAKSERRVSTATVKEAIGDLAGADPGGGELDLVRLWLGRPTVRYLGAATAALAVGVPFALSLMFNGAQPPRSAPDTFSGRAGYGARVEVSDPGIAPVIVPSVIDATRDEGVSPATVAVMEAEDLSSTGGFGSVKTIAAVAADEGTPRGSEAIPVAAVIPLESTGAIAAPASEMLPKLAPHNTVVADSIRRAEVLARSAAARLYENGNRVLSGDGVPAPERRVGPTVTRAVPQAASAPAAVVKPVAAAKIEVAQSVVPRATEPAARRVTTPVAPPAPEPVQVAKAIAKPTPRVSEPAARRVTTPVAPPAPEPVQVVKAIAKPTPRVTEPAARRVTTPVAPRAPEPVQVAKAIAKPAPRPSPVAKPAPAKRTLKETASIKRESAPARSGIVGLSAGQPPMGRLVRVRKNDTIWKIASRYYPDAGAATVEALLARNPALKNAGPLYEDQLLLLPFLTAQEMVVAGSDGSYRVLLSKAPSSSHTDAAMGWVGSTMPKMSVQSMQPRRLGDPYELYAVGFISRNDALAAADYVLFKLAELQAGVKSRRAGSEPRARYVTTPQSTTH